MITVDCLLPPGVASEARGGADVGPYEIQAVHTGAQTHFRFSLRLEGRRTYYAPGFYATREQAESAARTAARTRKATRLMTSALSLEPVDTALPMMHVDLHVPDDCVIRRQLCGVEQVRIDVGGASLYFSRKALAKLLSEGHLAEEDLELMAKFPDPLPEI